LWWIENHQVDLHAALYNSLEDTVHNTKRDIHIDDLGHCIILPFSYIGGPHYMNQCFQDAMALARHYQGFNLFFTFTCNPTWCEIQNKLLSGQTVSDQLDLAVCIFNMYKTKLVDKLAKHGILSAF
jgi:helitron helicase-like protein